MYRGSPPVREIPTSRIIIPTAEKYVRAGSRPRFRSARRYADCESTSARDAYSVSRISTIEGDEAGRDADAGVVGVRGDGVVEDVLERGLRARGGTDRR